MSEEKETKNKLPPIRKDDLITLLGQKANFYKKDTARIVDALIEILAEAIQNEQEIRVKGLFNLTYQHVTPERFHNVLTGEWEEGKKYTRCSLTLARQLRDLAIPDLTKRKIYQTRQAELRRAGIISEDDFDENENFDDIDDVDGVDEVDNFDNE
jgi:nucleoid DNA-binding protein